METLGHFVRLLDDRKLLPGRLRGAFHLLVGRKIADASGGRRRHGGDLARGRRAVQRPRHRPVQLLREVGLDPGDDLAARPPAGLVLGHRRGPARLDRGAVAGRGVDRRADAARLQVQPRPAGVEAEPEQPARAAAGRRGGEGRNARDRPPAARPSAAGRGGRPEK